MTSFFVNILTIFQREYNRVLVPTLGKINEINESYPHRTQTGHHQVIHRTLTAQLVWWHVVSGSVKWNSAGSMGRHVDEWFPYDAW